MNHRPFDLAEGVDDYTARCTRILGHRLEIQARTLMDELRHSLHYDEEHDYVKRKSIISIQLMLVGFRNERPSHVFRSPRTWVDHLKVAMRTRWRRLEKVRFFAPNYDYEKFEYDMYQKVCPHLGMNPNPSRCLEWASVGDADDDYELRYTYEEWLEIHHSQECHRAEVEERLRLRRQVLEGEAALHKLKATGPVTAEENEDGGVLRSD